MRVDFRRSARCAFTLIELLVSIAIIALLIALLLPTIKTAKELARRTACASQERQIMWALLGYVNDFRDFFPPGTWGTPTMINAGSEIIPRIQVHQVVDGDLEVGRNTGDIALRVMRCPSWRQLGGVPYDRPVYSRNGFPGSYGSDQVHMTYNYVGGHGNGGGIGHDGSLWWHGWVTYGAEIWNRYEDRDALGPVWHTSSRARTTETAILTDRMWLDPNDTPGGTNGVYPDNVADGTGWKIGLTHVVSDEGDAEGGNIGCVDGHVEWRNSQITKERVLVYSMYRPYICY